MGEVASCDTCRFENNDQKAVSSNVIIKRYAFDADHEELLVPEAACKFQKFHESTKESQCESAPEEFPTLLRSPKAARTTYKDECMLRFKLDPAADIGVHLVETSPSWPRTAVALLVVRSIEANSPFARDVDGRPGIQPGDALLEVNGCRGSPEELRKAFQQVELCNDAKYITLTVRPRPVSFNVSLNLDGLSPEKVGITVVIDKKHPKCVRVKAVHEQGLVPSWNASRPLLCVCPGDLIAGVNHIAGDSNAMREEIEDQIRCEHGSLVLHITTNTPRGKKNCPSHVCAAAPPWREFMQSFGEGAKENESANARNIWNSSPQLAQSNSRKLSL